MAWIELHQGLREHKKMFACADELNISRMEMIGTLVSIWLWALDNAQDGSLKGISNRTIARICDWPEKKADKLVETLAKTGWLDKEEDSYVIHDWYDYAGKLMERREADRQRKQNSKNKRRNSRENPSEDCGHKENTGCGTAEEGAGNAEEQQENSDGIPAERTRNSCATVPNRTVPYPLENIDDDAGYARERALIETDQREAARAVGKSDMLARSEEALKQAAALAKQLIAKWGGRGYAPIDAQMVFRYLATMPSGSSCYALDDGRRELLEYAFEKAALANCGGNWNYIQGILSNLDVRGIWTRAEAERDDRLRELKKERE